MDLSPRPSDAAPHYTTCVLIALPFPGSHRPRREMPRLLGEALEVRPWEWPAQVYVVLLLKKTLSRPRRALFLISGSISTLHSHRAT